MSRLMMVATILALVLLVSAPALADVSEKTKVSNSGNYAKQCTPSDQTGNDGDVKQKEEFDQEFSTLDDFESGGTTLTFGGSLPTSCSQADAQSSSASS